MLTQMKLMCCFASNITVTATATLLNISRKTVSIYFDNLRGEWLDNLIDQPITFEDNGEYEVDEVLIKHIWNPRRRRHQVLWVGGIFERETGKLRLHILRDRSQTSLIPPILSHVPSGSWIYSDDWRSYKVLQRHGYIHFTVNHSRREYSRPETLGGVNVNVHINTLEGINHEIRQKFANKSSRNLERVRLLLAEIMYRHSGRSYFWPFKVRQ